jgi:hypothetical protein
MSLPPDLPNDDESADDIEPDPALEAGSVPESFQSGQKTSKKAAQLLVDKGLGYVIPSALQRQNLLVAFAKKRKVVYGKAFDVVRLLSPMNLDDPSDVEANLSKLVLLEIKSSKKQLAPDFSGFFFALTAGEVLVAQSLKSQFRFVLVNTTTGDSLELTLAEIFGRARGIYPTWSISF